jgi:hypothetical protein
MMRGNRIGDDCLIGEVVRASVDRWIKNNRDDGGKEATISLYRKYTARKWVFLSTCLIALIVMCGLSLTVGQYSIGFW